MANSQNVQRHYDALVRLSAPPTHKTLVDFIAAIAHPELGNAREIAALMYGEAGRNTQIQKIAASLAPFVSQFGRLPNELFVGIFPTGSFNAQVVKTTDGPLILINTGAEFLIFELTKLFVLSAINMDASETLEPVGQIVNQRLTEGQVVEQIARLLYNYITQGSPEQVRKMPLPTGALIHMYAALATRTHEFLLAHEYGHIASGHLDKFPSANAIANPRSIEFNMKSVEMEMEADLVALNIFCAKVATSIGTRIDDPVKLFQLQLEFAAPTIFFGIAEMIESICRDVSGIARDALIGGHPPSQVRRQYSNEYFLQKSGDKALAIGRVFESWLEYYQETAILLTKRLL